MEALARPRRPLNAHFRMKRRLCSYPAAQKEAKWSHNMEGMSTWRFASDEIDCVRLSYSVL